MPVYSLVCPACDLTTERLVRMAERLNPPMPCEACGGRLQYAGLSLPAVGREQRFGAILEDGTRVKGGLHSVKRGSQAR